MGGGGGGGSGRRVLIMSVDFFDSSEIEVLWIQSIPPELLAVRSD